MITNTKTDLFTDESRTSPNDPDNVTDGWVFIGDNCPVGMWRRQICWVVMISGGEIVGNKLTGPFRVT